MIQKDQKPVYHPPDIGPIAALEELRGDNETLENAVDSYRDGDVSEETLVRSLLGARQSYQALRSLEAQRDQISIEELTEYIIDRLDSDSGRPQSPDSPNNPRVDNLGEVKQKVIQEHTTKGVESAKGRYEKLENRVYQKVDNSDNIPRRPDLKFNQEQD